MKDCENCCCILWDKNSPYQCKLPEGMVEHCTKRNELEDDEEEEDAKE